MALTATSMIHSGSGLARADQAAPNLIRVEVLGLHSNDGNVDCALFGSPSGFPDDSSQANSTQIVKIENAQAECSFSGIAPGDYAVSVFHDENANGKLDRNFVGIPKEGVGASNGATGHFGPPKFEDARFSYPGGLKTLTIHIQYLLAPL